MLDRSSLDPEPDVSALGLTAVYPATFAYSRDSSLKRDTTCVTQAMEHATGGNGSNGTAECFPLITAIGTSNLEVVPMDAE